MNDPGVDEPIKRAAEDVEADPHKREQDAEIEEEQDFMDPSRWWFASTAIPLIAGTFGPLANGFSICALVEYWREYIPTGGMESQGVPIQDPRWLVAVNAISLVSALIANSSLLLNMGRRLRFSIAQPVTIAGFALAAILLIADMAAVVSSPTHRLSATLDTKYPGIQNPAHHALRSAFYYAIIATALYLIIAALMCITVYGANSGHYEKEFKLTTSQRTLMLQTMSLVVYLLLGALIFSKLEGWDYLDAVYWADVTVLTIGLGDFAPATHTGRSLLIPFAIGGIVIIGLVIGSVRTLVLERGKNKLSARITEKKRESAVDSVNGRNIRLSMFTHVKFNEKNLSPTERREQEFKIMRQVQDAAEHERRWMALAISTFIALLLWFVGALVFKTSERNQGWSYFESLFFAYTSLLTIGYGDFEPTSNSGKPFFVIWSLMAIPTLTVLISNMSDTVISAFSEVTIKIGEITVLPGDKGFRASAKAAAKNLMPSINNIVKNAKITPPGIFGDVPGTNGTVKDSHENQMMDRIAERMIAHLEVDELEQAAEADSEHDVLDRDIHFYNYVLAREVRNVMKDLSASPPKRYDWGEWEYFLRIMGNQDDPDDFEGQRIDDILVPERLRVNPSQDKTMLEKEQPNNNTEAYTIQRKQRHSRQRQENSEFTWLSNTSPLMGTKSEAEWIVERLSAALERELNRSRKGFKRRPPVTYADMARRGRPASGQARSGSETEIEGGSKVRKEDHERGTEMAENEETGKVGDNNKQ